MDFAFVVSLIRVCRKNQQVVRISTVIQFSYPAPENGKVNYILLIRKAEAYNMLLSSDCHVSRNWPDWSFYLHRSMLCLLCYKQRLLCPGHSANPPSGYAAQCWRNYGCPLCYG